MNPLQHPGPDPRARPFRHPRYGVEQILGWDAGTGIQFGMDEWTGRAVVVKSAPLDLACREASCLLQLPEGIAPAVSDLLWEGSGRLRIVLERVQGRTLREIAATVGPDQLPGLVERISDLLVQLHRVGWVHGDLHPGNIILSDVGDDLVASLLDFGFAIHRLEPVIADQRGGAVLYLAPEVLRGWIVDGRADLFALGTDLSVHFPEVAVDARWQRIMLQLRDPLPARRYRSAAALQEDIVRTFGLETTAASHPKFPSGPMQGRQADLHFLLERLREQPGLRVLVQAGPGTGLTRFLQEVVLACARDRRPRIECVDLSGLKSPGAALQAIEHLELLARRSSSVLCGIPDLSPGLRWVEPAVRQRLESLLARGVWQRMALSPVDAAGYREIVAASLGTRGPMVDELARGLHHQTEGDLRSAIAGFDACMRTCGAPGESAWSMEEGALRRWLSAWRPEPPRPRLADAPGNLQRALRLCARAGRTFPRALAAALLRQFDQEDHLSQLEEHGYISKAGDDGLSFATDHLWRTTRSDQTDADDEAIDRWFAEHLEADPEDADAVIQASAIYRRTGYAEKEAAALSRGLESASGRRRWKDVARLLAYPDPPPEAWSLEGALQYAERQQRLLGPEWSADRCLLMAGESLRMVAPSVGFQLLERAASGINGVTATRALMLLLDSIIDQPGNPAAEGYLARLRSWASQAEVVPAGVLDFFAARHALAAGRTDDALARALNAESGLADSTLLYRVLNLQLLGVLKFREQPQEAIEVMNVAVAAARDPELQAQIRHNLALMLGQVGDPLASLSIAEAGVNAGEGRASPVRLAGLRLQRAWAMADLDRIAPAFAEAQALIHEPAVRSVPRHLTVVRTLLGFCHLHTGLAREALGESGRAWSDARGSSPLTLQANCLCYFMDAIIDLDAWDLVREFGTTLNLTAQDGDSAVRTTIVRRDALLAQAGGRLADATALLDAELGAARTLSAHTAKARYLHHLGRAWAARSIQENDPGSADRAISILEEELSLLQPPGHGYHRAQAMLALAQALGTRGRTGQRLRLASSAATLARDIQSRDLLRRCLRERVTARLERS